MLRSEARLPFFEQFRVDLTGMGASHLLTCGGASAAALRYRPMTVRGVPSNDALSTAVVETAIAVAGLVATFTGGVASPCPESDPTRGDDMMDLSYRHIVISSYQNERLRWTVGCVRCTR